MLEVVELVGVGPLAEAHLEVVEIQHCSILQWMASNTETLRKAELADAPDELPATLLKVLPFLTLRKKVCPHNIQGLFEAILCLESLFNRLSKEFQLHEKVEFLTCVLIAYLEVAELGEI